MERHAEFRAEESKHRPAPPRSAEAAMKVLVIDDDPDTVVFLSAWLEDNGYESCSAADGHLGMNAIRKERPDLVLLDVRMPNLTGVQLYRDIKTNREWGDLPVIFITGTSEFQVFDKECAPLPDPVALIPKPIDLKALLAAIRSALPG